MYTYLSVRRVARRPAATETGSSYRRRKLVSGRALRDSTTYATRKTTIANATLESALTTSDCFTFLCERSMMDGRQINEAARKQIFVRSYKTSVTLRWKKTSVTDET